MSLRSWKQAFDMNKFALDLTPKIWTLSPNHPHDHLYVDCAVEGDWSEFEMKTAFDLDRKGNVSILPAKWRNWQFKQQNSSDWVLVVIPENMNPVVLATTPGAANDFLAFMAAGLAQLRAYIGS